MITIGSMSKAFWAGLRIGWIRANPALIQRLAARARRARHLAARCSSSSSPSSCWRTPTRSSTRQRAAARARRDALVTALHAELPEWRFDAARRRARRCGSSSTRRAAPRSPRSPTATACALAAGPRFGVDGAFERFVRLPYALPERVLEDGASRLAVAWRSIADDGTARPMEPLSMVA